MVDVAGSSVDPSLAGMMDDLGSHRYDEFPLDDGHPDRPSYFVPKKAHVSVVKTEKVAAFSGLWKNAIASGKFIDEDYEAVKDLDSLGGPRLFDRNAAQDPVKNVALPPKPRPTNVLNSNAKSGSLGGLVPPGGSVVKFENSRTTTLTVATSAASRTHDIPTAPTTASMPPPQRLAKVRSQPSYISMSPASLSTSQTAVVPATSATDPVPPHLRKGIRPATSSNAPAVAAQKLPTSASCATVASVNQNTGHVGQTTTAPPSVAVKSVKAAARAPPSTNVQTPSSTSDPQNQTKPSVASLEERSRADQEVWSEPCTVRIRGRGGAVKGTATLKLAIDSGDKQDAVFTLKISESTEAFTHSLLYYVERLRAGPLIIIEFTSPGDDVGYSLTFLNDDASKTFASTTSNLQLAIKYNRLVEQKSDPLFGVEKQNESDASVAATLLSPVHSAPLARRRSYVEDMKALDQSDQEPTDQCGNLITEFPPLKKQDASGAFLKNLGRVLPAMAAMSPNEIVDMQDRVKVLGTTTETPVLTGFERDSVQRTADTRQSLHDLVAPGNSSQLGNPEVEASVNNSEKISGSRPNAHEPSMKLSVPQATNERISYQPDQLRDLRGNATESPAVLEKLPFLPPRRGSGQVTLSLDKRAHLKTEVSSAGRPPLAKTQEVIRDALAWVSAACPENSGVTSVSSIVPLTEKTTVKVAQPSDTKDCSSREQAHTEKNTEKKTDVIAAEPLSSLDSTIAAQPSETSDCSPQEQSVADKTKVITAETSNPINTVKTETVDHENLGEKFAKLTISEASPSVYTNDAVSQGNTTEVHCGAQQTLRAVQPTVADTASQVMNPMIAIPAIPGFTMTITFTPSTPSPSPGPGDSYPYYDTRVREVVDGYYTSSSDGGFMLSPAAVAFQPTQSSNTPSTPRSGSQPPRGLNSSRFADTWDTSIQNPGQFTGHLAPRN